MTRVVRAHTVAHRRGVYGARVLAGEAVDGFDVMWMMWGVGVWEGRDDSLSTWLVRVFSVSWQRIGRGCDKKGSFVVGVGEKVPELVSILAFPCLSRQAYES